MAPLRRLFRHFQTPTVGEPFGDGAACGQWSSASAPRPVGRTLRAATPRPAGVYPTRHANRSPLRVIRVVEVGQPSALTGRMLMSGRMADVCAELDRMVEREAAMRPGL